MILKMPKYIPVYTTVYTYILYTYAQFIYVGRGECRKCSYVAKGSKIYTFKS